MPNNYFEFTPEFVPGTKVRAGAVNVQFQALEAAFDLLPTEVAALTTNKTTFAVESGSGNTFVVAMPDTRTSEGSADEVVFFATHANTGAATLNVDGLGAKPLVKSDGTALAANDILNGLCYVVRYDSVNARYQVMNPVASYTTNAAASAAAAAASAAAASSSASAASSSASNASDEAGYAQEWAENVEDDPVSVAAGGDNSTTFSALHWAAKAATSAIRGVVNTNINTSSPPTTEAVIGAHEIWDLADNDILSRMGFVGSNTLQIQNYMHGGTVLISAEDSSGDQQSVFAGDPEGRASLYYAGSATFRTRDDGVDVVGAVAPAIGGVQDSRIVFYDNGLTAIGEMGYTNSANMVFQSYNHGASLILRGENAAGNAQNILTGNPDGASVLYYAGTQAAAVNGLASFSVYGDDATDTDSRFFEIRNSAGTRRAFMGHAGDENLRLRNEVHGGTINLEGEDSGGTNRVCVVGDPDGATALYYAGEQTFAARNSGVVTIYGDDNSDVDTRLIEIRQANGTRRAFIGNVGSTTLFFRNEIHGGAVQIAGEDAGGSSQIILEGDPDGATTLYYAGTSVARTGTTTNGGLEANNTLTGVGYERVLTESDNVLFARKTANTARNNTATPADDPHLTVAVPVTGVYLVEALLSVSCPSATPDIRIDWNMPSLAAAGSALIIAVEEGVGVSSESDVGSFASYSAIALTAGNTFMIKISGVVEFSATGDATLQWSQDTSNAALVTMFANSYITLKHVG